MTYEDPYPRLSVLEPQWDFSLMLQMLPIKEAFADLEKALDSYNSATDPVDIAEAKEERDLCDATLWYIVSGYFKYVRPLSVMN